METLTAKRGILVMASSSEDLKVKRSSHQDRELRIQGLRRAVSWHWTLTLVLKGA